MQSSLHSFSLVPQLQLRASQWLAAALSSSVNSKTNSVMADICDVTDVIAVTHVSGSDHGGNLKALSWPCDDDNVTNDVLSVLDDVCVGELLRDGLRSTRFSSWRPRRCVGGKRSGLGLTR